jgi:SAM-dependent methyltransferase
MTTPAAYWDKVGSDWDLIGPPLRPCIEDIAIMEQLVARWTNYTCNAALQAVVLGVTQEIIEMKWPEKTHILAFDQELAMINSIWPRHRYANAAAICSNWLSLPLVDGYADIVMCDGSFTLLAFDEEYQKLALELSRILAPDGIVIARMYVAPDCKQPVEDVFKDLWNNKIGNFNTFKWRLAMALIDPSDFSVSVNKVFEAWSARMISAEQLSEELNWPLAVIQMIERYKDCASTRYSFPPLHRIREIMAPQFRQEEIIIPSYQDGERYPTLCFRKV